MIKPEHLKRGDKIAAVSLSKGLAGLLPYRYEIGKKQIRKTFGLEVVEMKNTLKDPIWVYKNPKARAEDLMEAFEDKSVKGIFSTIGGEDSIRILPFLDLKVITNNPKIFMGYSDTTVSHLICYKAKLTTFYGPSIMANLAENQGILPYTTNYLKKAIFSTKPIGEVIQAKIWTNEFLDWNNPKNQDCKRTGQPPLGRKLIQGKGKVQGHLIGGCVQVLLTLIGTSIWPRKQQWKGGILFLEISEAEMPASHFRYFLRNLAISGVLENVVGILFGRTGGNRNNSEILEYDQILEEIIVGEFNLSKLAILTQLDFGHTDPIFTIPYGVKAEIDCDQKMLTILESGVV